MFIPLHFFYTRCLTPYTILVYLNSPYHNSAVHWFWYCKYHYSTVCTQRADVTVQLNSVVLCCAVLTAGSHTMKQFRCNT
jgi:hypothetical protein